VTVGTDRNATITSATVFRHTGDLAFAVQTPTVPEAAMSTTVSPLERIDADLGLAAVAVGVARGSYARCPSVENARVLDRAAAGVGGMWGEGREGGRPSPAGVDHRVALRTRDVRPL
jgi:hypothetical protein